MRIEQEFGFPRIFDVTRGFRIGAENEAGRVVEIDRNPRSVLAGRRRREKRAR